MHIGCTLRTDGHNDKYLTISATNLDAFRNNLR